MPEIQWITTAAEFCGKSQTFDWTPMLDEWNNNNNKILRLSNDSDRVTCARNLMDYYSDKREFLPSEWWFQRFDFFRDKWSSAEPATIFFFSSTAYKNPLSERITAARRCPLEERLLYFLNSEVPCRNSDKRLSLLLIFRRKRSADDFTPIKMKLLR